MACRSRGAPAAVGIAALLALPGCCVEDADCTDTGGQFCVVGRCEALICTYPDRDCSDEVGCTEDSCDEDADQCVNDPVDALCDDGLYCNGSELCDPTLDCIAGAPPDCGDGVGCTVDSCNETTDLCEHAPDDALCDDGVGCTVDECDAATDCSNTPDDALCDDEDVCTGAEWCDPAADCQPGVPLACDDGLYCNGAESCDPSLGCQPGVSPDCADGVDCTVDWCDEDADACANDPDDALCDDGLWCNGAERCDAIAGCLPGEAPPCDDSNDCTEDLCDEDADTCAHLPLSGTPCDYEGGGPGTGMCLDGVCLARGCGDGYVEPGPTPPAEECDPGPGGPTAGCTDSCRSVDFRVSGVLPEPDRNGDQEIDRGTPAVAALADGRLVVVWTRDIGTGSGPPDWPDGAFLDVRARLFSSSGEPEGAVIQLNPDLSGIQRDPAVARLGDGFVAVWSDDRVTGSLETVLWARAFDAGGAATGRGRQVNTTALLGHTPPALAAVPGSGAVAVWEVLEPGGGASSVLMRWLDSDGRPLGTADEAASAGAARFERSPAVAVSAGATVALVVWVVEDAWWADQWVAGMLFDVGTGLPVTAADLVLSSPPVGEDDFEPTVAALPAGGFLLAHRRSSASRSVLVARTVSEAGALGPDAELAAPEDDWTYLSPSVAARADGTAALAWSDARRPSADSSSDAVAGALCEPVGLGGAPELASDVEVLSTTTAWDQVTPQLATSGDALAVCFTDWSGEGDDTDGAQLRCRVLGGGWLVEDAVH